MTAIVLIHQRRFWRFPALGGCLILLAALANAAGADLPKAFSPEARILFQGDSITDGNRGRNADPNHILGHGYAFIIAADIGGHFPERKLTFINRGISGNKVSDLAARWQKDALDLKPDILSILIGVNDVGAPLRSTNRISIGQFESDCERILSEARRANPQLKIVLGEPFILPGKGTTNRWDDWQVDIKKIQAAVARLGEKYQAPVVHFQKVFNEAAERAPVEYWIWDGVHPTYAGHQLMADEWLKAVAAAWP
jgi:lysophospholipase L1-like esterase